MITWFFFNDIHDGVHDVRAGFFVFLKMYFIQSERVYYTLMKKDIFLNNPCWFYAFSDFFFGLFDKNPLFQPWVVLICLKKIIMRLMLCVQLLYLIIVFWTQMVILEHRWLVVYMSSVCVHFLHAFYFLLQLLSLYIIHV